jgi:hypothetical protein
MHFAVVVNGQAQTNEPLFEIADFDPASFTFWEGIYRLIPLHLKAKFPLFILH